MYISVKALARQEGCSVDLIYLNIKEMEATDMYPLAVKESGGLKIDPEAYNRFLCRKRRLKINKRKDSDVGASKSVPERSITNEQK